MTDSQNNSLFKNFTNKIKYNLYKASYDPEANDFVEKQNTDKALGAETPPVNNTDSTTSNSSTNDVKNNVTNDVSGFSSKRLITKIGNQTWNSIKLGLIPFISLMLAMIVTNEFIVYPVPIRIIFFIFTFVICFFTPIYMVMLCIFYVLKSGYSYYYNNMTNNPKKYIMPPIFALCPITTYKPVSSIMSFILYPFTYPKTEKGDLILSDIMKQYWNELMLSFPELNKMEGILNLTNSISKLKNRIFAIDTNKA